MLPEARVDELESAGYEGLVQAALRYDPESGVAFGAFAHYRIRGAMIDWFRSQTPGLRRHQRALRALQASQSVLEQAADERGSDRRALEDRVAAARKLVERTATSIMAARAMTKEPEELAGSDDPEQAVLDGELRTRLGQVLTDLSEEEAALVDAIYQRGESMRDLAKKAGVNTSTISRRHAKLMSRLAERLKN
jgi:RNA polymerase sigma factor (sigma-70 family)